MIEETVRAHLESRCGVPVVLEDPESPPASYIRIEKAGSGRENHLNRATFAVQSYGGTLYAAAALNETAKGAMDALAELDEVAASRLESDYNFTDTATKRYRYQAVYEIFYY